MIFNGKIYQKYNIESISKIGNEMDTATGIGKLNITSFAADVANDLYNDPEKVDQILLT